MDHSLGRVLVWRGPAAAIVLELLVVLCLGGCGSGMHRPELAGLDAGELATLKAEHLDLQYEIGLAKNTVEYQCVFEEVNRRKQEWSWAVGYYQLFCSHTEKGDPKVNTAVLVLYEDKRGRLGYITNSLGIPLGTNELSVGDPVVVHEKLAAPPGGERGENAASAAQLTQAAESLRRLIAGLAGKAASMDPEAGSCDAAQISIVEALWPGGKSSIVAVNSVQLDREDAAPGDRLTSATYEVMEIWHRLLRASRMGNEGLEGVTAPLVGADKEEPANR